VKITNKPKRPAQLSQVAGIFDRQGAHPWPEFSTDLRFQVEAVVGDGQVVLQTERGQQDAVAHRECQAHLA
jgi:hypothetical protein